MYLDSSPPVWPAIVEASAVVVATLVRGTCRPDDAITMKRASFNSANIPPFDDAERVAIERQAQERGLNNLRCPRDDSRLLVKDVSLGRFAVQCLECHRWALTLEAPQRAEGEN